MLIWRCISPDLYASSPLFIVPFIEMSFTFTKKSILKLHDYEVWWRLKIIYLFNSLLPLSLCADKCNQLCTGLRGGSLTGNYTAKDFDNKLQGAPFKAAPSQSTSIAVSGYICFGWYLEPRVYSAFLGLVNIIIHTDVSVVPVNRISLLSTCLMKYLEGLDQFTAERLQRYVARASKAHYLIFHS